MSLFNRPEEKETRRRLRRTMTQPEYRVWFRLRDRQLHGHKFRRQFSMGPYILDFYCPQLHLAVEIDGDSHSESQEYDARRQRIIESYGVEFVRFSNNDVRDNLEGVLERLAEVADRLDAVKENRNSKG